MSAIAKRWLKKQTKFNSRARLSRIVIEPGDMGIAQSLKGAGMLHQLTQVVMGERSPAPIFEITGCGMNWLAGRLRKHAKARSSGRIRMPSAER